jgi:beta-lactamase class A
MTRTHEGFHSRFREQRAPFRIGLLALAVLALAACGTAGRSSPDTVSQRGVTEVPALNTPIPIGRSPTPTATPTVTPVPTNTPLPYSEEWPAELASVANSLIDQEDGVFGVVMLDSSGDVLFSRNSTAPFITASLYKLILMADILKRVEYGQLSLDQEVALQPDVFQDGPSGDTYFTQEEIGATATIRELLYAVGDYSSNVSARSLLQFTDWASLTQTARESGMERTYFAIDPTTLPEWPPAPGADSTPAETDIALQFVMENFERDGPVNLTTASDMADYQLGLIKGTVVTPYVSAQILSILGEQEIDDRIPALLDDRFDPHHKPGNLIHAVHDVGVIFTPGEPRVLAALSEGLIWDGRAHEVIQRLALVATGQKVVPPVSESSMVDGGVVQVVFGPRQDARQLIKDPEALRPSPTPTVEASAEAG